MQKWPVEIAMKTRNVANSAKTNERYKEIKGR